MRIGHIGGIATTVALTFSDPTWAADNNAPGEALDVVVVTAQKREERILDVPISMAALTETALRDAGATQLSDVLGGVPGVGIVDNGSGQQFIQIRGINSVYGNSPVGYYLDELPFSYLGNTQLPDVRTYDLQRIEVLRGPQGTLYGDGSLGGTIRILTNEPDLTRLQASADLDGATTRDGAPSNSEQAMLNLPLKTDELGVRLVGSHEHFGGWVDDAATGERNLNARTADTFRAKIRYQPTERLDVILSGWHLREYGLGDSTSLPDRTTVDPVAQNDTEYNLYSATLRYRFDAVDVVSATSRMQFYNRQEISDYFGLGNYDTLEHQGFWSEELRLTSRGSGPFRWSTGFFYRQIERHTNLVLSGLGITQDQTQRSNSYALFGEGTYSITPRLDATVGLRAFKDDRLFREPVDPDLLALIQSTHPEFTGTTRPSFHTVNPKFNLAYKLTDGWLLYANAAKGFRTGQAQAVISLELAILNNISIPTGVNPETLWSYEVGTKRDFANGVLTLEADGFYNRWKDLQTVVFVGPGIGSLINAGKAHTAGGEFASTWRPLTGLSLQLAAGVVDAKYDETIAGTNIKDGDSVISVPKFTLSASGLYRWPLWHSLNGLFRAEIQHTSARYDVVNAAPPSDTINDINMRLGVEGTAWGAYLTAENLKDDKGAIDVAAGGYQGSPRLRPRTLGLHLRYNFE